MKNVKKLLSIVLTVCMILSVLPMTALAAMAPAVKLSSLTAGSTVSYGGLDWTVLNPQTGYLCMKNAWSDSSIAYDIAYDKYASAIYDPTYTNNIAYAANTTFYNSLPAADAALIQPHTWNIGYYDQAAKPNVNHETDKTASCKIGMLSYTEWQSYHQYISEPSKFWLITPSESGYSCAFRNWISSNAGGVITLYGTNSNSTGPALFSLYLSPDAAVSNGTVLGGTTPYPVPAVTGVSPSTGYTVGGASVTVTGYGFLNASAVNFGANAATSFTVDDNNTITAVAPAGTGTVDVTVTGPGGTSSAVSADQFVYTAAPAPTVTGISPTIGLTIGGGTVTIIGSDLTGATEVDFGATKATSFTVDDDNTITAVAPAGTGTVDVTVTGPGGMSAALPADQYTYVAGSIPAVTSVAPAVGSNDGGTSVTITGTGFAGTTAVTFGSIAATGFDVNNDGTQITAIAPAQSAATVDVTVTNPLGTSSTSSANMFTYQTTLYSITVASGVTGGTITPSVTSAASGTTVTLAVTPDDNMMLKSGTLMVNGNGIPGDSFTMPAGNVTITATFQSVYVFDSSTGTIVSYIGTGGNISIPSQIGGVTVTAIGAGAFSHSAAITSLVIPDSVTSIGSAAFYGCYNLTSVTIPDSVTSIGSTAFAYTGLTSVTLPSRLAKLAVGVFYYTDLTSVTIPASVTAIDAGAFQDCLDLRQVTFQGSCPTFGNLVFSNSSTNQNLVTIYYPGGDTAYTAEHVLSGITLTAYYTVTYNANNADSGSVPSDSTMYYDGSAVTVSSNTGNLARTGYVFDGWNTAADGSGTRYAPADAITFGTGTGNVKSAVTLCAQWLKTSYTPPSTPTPTTVTGSVINGTNGAKVSNITATVTTDSSGNSTVSMQAADVIGMKGPDGTGGSMFGDLSKLALTSTGGSAITVTAEGTLSIGSLAKGTDNTYDIVYDLGNGQKIVVGTMEVKIDSSGKVSLTASLIDPYGIITDATTGKALAGVNVTLYYADTSRNKAAGKTPDTVVVLPGITGFKPNNNQDPQTSDLSGTYGFMVFQDTDYYIVATKDGYDQYTSPTISVDKEIVHWDFKMSPTTSGVTRLAGQSRVDTALAIAKAEYPGKLENVVLATADNYPDALAGSALAYKLNAPILLVGSSEADQAKVLDYLKSNLDPAGTVYILGGTGAVSSAMEAKVTATGFNHITRLGGTDRYETAVKIAGQLGVRSGTPVVLVTGENYPDGLSVSSVAAQMQLPVLLVRKDGISGAVAQEIAAIKPAKVYIIGREGAIGTAVENQVAQITGLAQANIVRIGGADRYETSLAVAQYFRLSGQSVCVATGNNFPDAMAGSVYAANFNAPIILADGSLSDKAMNYLQTRKMTGATIFGGEAVVSKDIEQKLLQLIGK